MTRKMENCASAEKIIGINESYASQGGSGCCDVTLKETLEQEGVRMAVITEGTGDNNDPPNKANAKVTHEAAASSASDQESGTSGETTGGTSSGKLTKEERSGSSDPVVGGKDSRASLIKMIFCSKHAHPVNKKHNNKGRL